MARFKMFGGKKPTGVALQVTKIFTQHEDGTITVTVESLDDAIRNTQKITDQKNFVPGNAIYNEGVSILKQYLHACCDITHQLIKDGELESDKYNLLSAKTKSFRKQNELVNRLLMELKQERLEAGRKQREENPESEEAQAPFSEEQVSNIISEPDPKDPETHTAEEETKDGGWFRFDKINYTVRVRLMDGTYKDFRMAPEGSWRNTAIKWLQRMWDGFKKVIKSSTDKVIEVTKETGSIISKGWGNAITRIRSLGTKKKPDNFINENGDIEAVKKDEPKPE